MCGVGLEEELTALLNEQSPSECSVRQMVQLREELQNKLEQVVLLDLELSHELHIDERLWRLGFMRPIEWLRQALAECTAGEGRAGGHLEGRSGGQLEGRSGNGHAAGREAGRDPRDRGERGERTYTEVLRAQLVGQCLLQIYDHVRFHSSSPSCILHLVARLSTRRDHDKIPRLVTKPLYKVFKRRFQ